MTLDADLIVQALQASGGHRAAAAHALGVSPRTLARWLLADPGLYPEAMPPKAEDRLIRIEIEREMRRDDERERAFARRGKLREADRMLARWAREDERPPALSAVKADDEQLAEFIRRNDLPTS